MVLGRKVLRRCLAEGKGHAELGLVSASMAVRHKANANGKIILVTDLVASRSIALDLDLARAGVKTGPYVSEATRVARGWNAGSRYAVKVGFIGPGNKLLSRAVDRLDRGFGSIQCCLGLAGELTFCDQV